MHQEPTLVKVDSVTRFTKKERVEMFKHIEETFQGLIGTVQQGKLELDRIFTQ
jgi:hypothetical protein